MSIPTPTEHATTVELSEPAPAEVAVGSTFAVTLKVYCAEGCDLHGSQITVVPPDGWISTTPLETFDDGVNQSGEITLTAPKSVGEHFWSFSIALHGADVVHDGALHLPIRTRAQESSLAVWSIPSPLVIGERFEIAVGAKSEGGCVLTGTRIEVCDQDGAVLARGQLGDTPWPGTSALYWTPVALTAPAACGMQTWSVRFAANDVEVPHQGSSGVFSLVVVPPPEHRLTIKVVAKETAAPIENAQVRLGAFRAATDPAGLAQLHMPSGSYDLMVWKVGYEAPARTVEVTGDAALEVEVITLPEDNPDTRWQM
jgi:hypothetical protein